MVEMFEVRRQALIQGLAEKCRQECTLAKYVIANVCREAESGERRLGIKAGRQILSRCVDGPMLVGTCGTEKVICAHETVDHTANSLEQVRLLREELLYEVSVD